MDTKQNLNLSDNSTLEVASMTLKECLADVMHNFPKAVQRKKDDSARVHELRVSTRRVEAAIELFEEFTPRRATQRLVRKLTDLRQMAGSARDCDVFASRFAEWLQGDATAPLASELEQWRAEGQRLLVELYKKWERGDKLERLATEVLCNVRSRGKGTTSRDETFDRFARQRLRRIVRDFFAGERTDPKNLKRLHAFRIRVKRLRYCLELLGPGLAEESVKDAHRLLRKLSQRLGNINDHATAVELLTQWQNDHDEDGSAELLDSLRNRERKELRKSVAEFREWWTPRRRRRVYRRLKRAWRSCQKVA